MRLSHPVRCAILWLTLIALLAVPAEAIVSFETDKFISQVVGPDNSDMDHDGNSTVLFVTDTDTATDIQLVRSTDAGATWAPGVGFDDETITGPGSAGRPVISHVDGAQWVGVYKFVPSGGDFDLYARVSSDGGISWSDPALVDPVGAPGDSHQDTALGLECAQGVCVLVGCSSLGYYRSLSFDDGTTWSSPTVFGVGPVSCTGDVVSDGSGNWLVVWQSSDDLGGTIGGDDDILFIRSTDNASSWSSAAALNVAAATDSLNEDDPRVDVNASGTWIVTWKQPTESLSDSRTVVARSIDLGATWSPEIFVDTPGITGTEPRIGAGAGSEWVVAYSTSAVAPQLGGDIEVFYSRSTDDGLSWTLPVLLNRDGIVDHIDSPHPDTNKALHVMQIGSTWLAAITGDGNVTTVRVARSVAACPTLPDPSCDAGVNQRVGIREAAIHRDSIKLKVKDAALGALGDLGDPTTASDYVLCLWDDQGGQPVLVYEQDAHAGTTCAGKPCWRQVGAGYRFKDNRLENSSISRLSLAPKKSDTELKITAKLRGLAVGPPQLPLSVDPSVRVQLHNLADGHCWEASFDQPKKNDTQRFDAKEP